MFIYTITLIGLLLLLIINVKEKAIRNRVPSAPVYKGTLFSLEKNKTEDANNLPLLLLKRLKSFFALLTFVAVIFSALQIYLLHAQVFESGVVTIQTIEEYIATLNKILNILSISPAVIIIAGLVFIALSMTSLFSLSSRVSSILFTSAGHLSKLSFIIGLISCVTFFGGNLKNGIIDGIAKLNTKSLEIQKLYQASVETLVENSEIDAIKEVLKEYEHGNIIDELGLLFDDNQNYLNEVRIFERALKVAINVGLIANDDANKIKPKQYKNLKIDSINSISSNRNILSGDIYLNLVGKKSWSRNGGKDILSKSNSISSQKAHLGAIQQVFTSSYDASAKTAIKSTIINAIPEEFGKAFFEIIINETFHNAVKDKISGKVSQYFKSNMAQVILEGNQSIEINQNLRHAARSISRARKNVLAKKNELKKIISIFSQETLPLLKYAFSELGPFNDNPNLKKSLVEFRNSMLKTAQSASSSSDFLALLEVAPQLLNASTLPEPEQAKLLSRIEKNHLGGKGGFAVAFRASDLNVTNEFVNNIAKKVQDGNSLTQRETKIWTKFKQKGMCLCWSMKGMPRPKGCSDPRCV